MAESGATRATGALRVVPLFETLDDLDGAAGNLEKLFLSPGYAERTGRTQEVMVGYSDSAKDAGRLAAVWAQFEAQERMLAVAKKHGFELTFFHGKGGTVARGGNPALYEVRDDAQTRRAAEALSARDASNPVLPRARRRCSRIRRARSTGASA